MLSFKKKQNSVEINEIVQTITANEFNSKVFLTLPLPLCMRVFGTFKRQNIPME